MMCPNTPVNARKGAYNRLSRGGWYEASAAGCKAANRLSETEAACQEKVSIFGGAA